MKTKCQNDPNKDCGCKKLHKVFRYLYLIPTVVCIAFAVLFESVEAKYQTAAYDSLAEDNHIVFDRLNEIRAQVDPDFHTFYVDTIVNKVTNTNYTFGVTDTSDTDHPVVGELSNRGAFADTSLVDEHEFYIDGLGLTRVWVYKQPDKDLWVFGTYDADLIKQQRTALSTLIAVMLILTTVLNYLLLYFINSNIHGGKK